MQAAVTAIRCDRALQRALVRAVRIFLVVVSEVTLLRAVLLPVTAVRSKGAVGTARAVASVVLAVVTFLTGLAEAVAALELAAQIARAAFGPVVFSVVALLARVDFAVAASRIRGGVDRAVEPAKAWTNPRFAAVETPLFSAVP